MNFWSQLLFQKCRLCERDPYQLYQRLEQQAREYVLEMKVRLLRHLSLGSKVASTLSIPGPPQAHQFISLLLEEYSALCQAACTISTFLVTLVRYKKFFFLCAIVEIIQICKKSCCEFFHNPFCSLQSISFVCLGV